MGFTGVWPNEACHAWMLGALFGGTRRFAVTGKRERFVSEYPCHAPGVERWFDLTVYPLKSPVKGVILSHWNVTERRLAETFLRCLALEHQEQAEGALQRLIRPGQHL